MRTILGVGLVAVCLGLAGCSSFGKKKPKADTARPFAGAPASPAPTEVAAAGGTGAPSGVDGIIAGQVLDRYNRPFAKVAIKHVDLQENQKGAPIDVLTDNNGYFVIAGLKVGHHYQLVARASEGGRTLKGTTVTAPPNPRVNIYLSEQFTTTDTPPPPPPSLPGRHGKDGKGTDDAKIDPPVKTKEGATTPGSETKLPGGTGLPGNVLPVADPTKIVRDTEIRDGFERSPWRSVPKDEATLSVPSRPDRVPLPPPTRPEADAPLPPVGVAPPAPALAPEAAPLAAAPVPSCVLEGRTLRDMSLYALNLQPGAYRQQLQPWEYRRHHSRLTLLDFWGTYCGPCKAGIPHLTELQSRYGDRGLQVVGIAYESGTPAEQVRKIQAVHRQLHFNYTLLLGGGPRCPVKSQFQIHALPTLILLNEKGEIVGRWEGLDNEGKAELDHVIRRQLLFNP